ncbi:MAG: bifunctional metallophosphatase/5'-nucleotidase [Hyphomicrobiaceae bacterium]
MLAAISVVWGVSAASAQSRTVHVTLALICDIYEMNAHKGRGGFARLAAVIKAERARSKNVIVTHAGDTISPSLFSSFDKGEHIIALTNMIAPDVFVPGNHEFDFGEKVYRKRMAEARFPVLAANLRSASGARLEGHVDVKHFTFDGVKIAVLGLTADNAPKKSSPGSLQFAATVPHGKKLAQQLRDDGADLVVAVAHANRKQDIRLFYSGVLDVLLTGDDHDLAVLYNGRTAMAEAMVEGEFVTLIDLAITVETKAGGKRSISWRPKFRIIDTADVAPDPQVVARVQAYQKTLSKELDVPLGKTRTGLDSRKAAVRVRETAMGNLIADALRQRAGADIALFNGGGIRGNKVYPAGTVLTRRDVLTELPFGNKMFVLEMTGADLRAALENSLWYAGKPNGRFAHLSGLRVRANGKAVPGKRIKNLTIGGAPVNAGRRYKVATNGFMASGKEGYGVLKQAKILIGETDGPLVSNVVMSYIRARGTIAPKPEGRIVID